MVSSNKLWKHTNTLKHITVCKIFPFDQIGKVFANGPGDQGSIPGRIIPNTQMVINTSLLNTQHYEVRIKGKVKQSKERSIAFPNTSVL